MTLDNAASSDDVVNNANATVQTTVNTYLYNSTGKFNAISNQLNVGI